MKTMTPAPAHVNAASAALAACLLALGLPFALAQQPDTGPQTPPQATAPAETEVQAIMRKTLETYSNAKSYDAIWSYVLQRGADVQHAQRIVMEIRKKGKDQLYVHLGPAPGQPAPTASDLVPETLVVVDGGHAWCENATTRQFYRVELPRNAPALSPLTFIPHLPSKGDVHRATGPATDPTTIVLQADSLYGGNVRMEIDGTTYRIRRLVAENQATKSTITVEHETFDGEIPDSAFSFRAARGAVEIPAPAEAAAIFGASTH